MPGLRLTAVKLSGRFRVLRVSVSGFGFKGFGLGFRVLRVPVEGLGF